MRRAGIRRRTPLRRGRPLARRTPLKRDTPLKRGALAPASVAQRVKVAGRHCLVCDAATRIDPAHLVPRGLGGCDDALCVVALCRLCHRRYDGGGLDLVAHLKPGHRAEAAHAVEHLGLAGVAQVAGEIAELLEAGALLALAADQPGQPRGVEPARLHRQRRLLLQAVGLALEQVAGRLEMAVEGLTRDQQVHDLRGALEDAVDAHVAQRLLDGHGPLAARLQRGGGLVAAAARRAATDRRPADLTRLGRAVPGALWLPSARRA